MCLIFITVRKLTWKPPKVGQFTSFPLWGFSRYINVNYSAWHVYTDFFFYSSVATYRHACSENSLSINEKKKAREKSGKWSGIEEIGVRALAQLRVLYSDRARSFYQWPARVISELFLKDDTFVWVAVFSEFCLQPATAVNVFECPSTSFIDDDQYQYLGNCPPTPLLSQHKP